MRLRPGLVRPRGLVKVFLRDAEAEAKGRRLWLGPVLFRREPAAGSLIVVDIHEPQAIRQRIQTRAAFLADDAARGPSRAGARLARAAGLVLVLPAVGVLAVVVRGGRRQLLARRRRIACRADGAATGPAVGGDAATCCFGVERVVAREERLGGGAGEGGHRERDEASRAEGECCVCLFSIVLLLMFLRIVPYRDELRVAASSRRLLNVNCLPLSAARPMPRPTSRFFSCLVLFVVQRASTHLKLPRARGSRGSHSFD